MICFAKDENDRMRHRSSVGTRCPSVPCSQRLEVAKEGAASLAAAIRRTTRLFEARSRTIEPRAARLSHHVASGANVKHKGHCVSSARRLTQPSFVHSHSFHHNGVLTPFSGLTRQWSF